MPTDKYKGMIIQGSTFPDDPYKIVPVKLNDTIRKEYLPVLEKMALPKGLKLLMTVMTSMEGFRPGTRSYRTNNPGNIGNTDSGANKVISSLEEGIALQAKFLTDIAEGRKKQYPLGKLVSMKPYESPEIWANLKNYGVETGNVPGYRFVYTGKLSEFIKIYATLPRISNNYLNVIMSYFKQNGVDITPDTTLQEIISPGEELTGGAAAAKAGED